MTRFLIQTFTILSFSVLHVVFCQEQAIQEQRSTIMEIDGYAYLSEDKTIQELREEALINARKTALERVQTYIKSYATVENFILTCDLIQSKTEGYVKILDSKDYGITADNRYHVWIRAEVEYKMENVGEEFSATHPTDGAVPLSVSVWTDKHVYYPGEEIRIFLRGNKDFYARIIYRDAGGRLLQLLPNQYQQDNFFKSGKEYIIPGKVDKFNLIVEPPFGQELIIVYTSTIPLGEVSIDAYGEVLYQVRGALENLAMATRGIRINDKNGTNPVVDFYEVRCNLTTREMLKY